MIVIRGATGYVLIRVSQSRDGQPRTMYCLNDSTSLELPRGPDSAIVSGLGTVLAHAIQLAGAVQWITELDLD